VAKTSKTKITTKSTASPKAKIQFITKTQFKQRLKPGQNKSKTSLKPTQNQNKSSIRSSPNYSKTSVKTGLKAESSQNHVTKRKFKTSPKQSQNQVKYQDIHLIPFPLNQIQGPRVNLYHFPLGKFSFHFHLESPINLTCMFLDDHHKPNPRQFLITI